MPRSHEASVAAGLKSAITTREKYGKDHFRNDNIRGGKLSTPGYFGHLKATGQTETLQKISRKAAEARKTNKSQSTSKKNLRVGDS